MYCKNCGKEIDGKFCSHCGHNQNNSLNNQQTITVQAVDGSSFRTSPKNRTVALILCILFGLLGIHQFYVGKIGKGVLYLFTGGLLGIGYFIDIIKIATGTFTDFMGLFIRKWSLS